MRRTAPGFFCFLAPKGQNEIAQGKAKRRPGYDDPWISSPLSSAPSGRDSISTFKPTGRCPGLSPCAPLGQKARNQGQSPRDSVAFIHKRVEDPFDKKPGTVPAQQGESPRCRVFLRRLQLAESGASTSVSSYLQV